MQKKLKPYWFLQALVEEVTRPFAATMKFIPVVQESHDPIWDEDCPAVGRSAWHCGFIFPDGKPAPEVIAAIRSVLTPWQARYDLGATAA